MELSEAERLILYNLYEIRRQRDPDNSRRYEVIQKVLQAGYRTLYGEVLDRMWPEKISKERAKFVADILDMYGALQHFRKETGADLPALLRDFPGFDGHGDLPGYARMLIEELSLFEYVRPLRNASVS